MSAAAIRALGIGTFVFEALILFAGIGPREWIFGPPPKARIFFALAFCVVATSVGVGLLLLRKWAAVVFSLALIGLPTWMAFASIGEAPIGPYLILVAVMVVLAMPIIIIVRSWRLLSWRGKWFL